MEAGLVSVIITTYKRAESMLQQAIDSVLGQTYANKELIVVSDNPPESEAAQSIAVFMRGYPDVRFIQLERNSGAQVARNTGIRAGRGEFVGFLDDDDMWLPEKLARQIPCFADPRVGLVYCRGYEFDDDDPALHRDYSNARWGFHTKAKYEELLVRDYIGSTSQAVIRRSCFEDCGYFDEALKARQDYDRWLAITSKGYRAVGVDEPLFLHRMHKGEQITKSPTVALEANAYVFRKYGKDFRKSRKACMAYYYNRAFVYQSMGRRGAYLRNALRSFLCSPADFRTKYRSYREGE